jgi:hypothetical protein
MGSESRESGSREPQKIESPTAKIVHLRDVLPTYSCVYWAKSAGKMRPSVFKGTQCGRNMKRTGGSDFDQRGGVVSKQARPCRGLTRRDFLLAGAGAGLFVFGLGGGWPLGGSEAEAAPLDLDVFGGFPRAFYGRHVEGEVRSGDYSYEEWEKRNLPLGGILGKVLNEAHDYTGRNNLEWFLRYKNQNPSKMVLLHYNGTGRRATDEATTRFFSGHFLYYKGTRLTRGIANRTQDVLHVADTSIFKTKRLGTDVSDDIAIVRLGPGRTPNWQTAEHVRLVDIDGRNNTITVQRGKYGTRRETFPKGSYIAAHVMTGPYRFNNAPQQNIPLWNYNFSTACPRDEQGRNCADALPEYLGEKLGPGGQLSSFDGIIFDVFSWVIRFGHPIHAIDVNTDGRADRGILGGANTVSQGALEFLVKLRERLGPDKLILADGHIPSKSQRGFEALNGMESEGYPDKYDIGLDHTSRGENIFNYWKEHSAPPSLHYANFRYKQKRPKRYRNTFTEPTLSHDKSYRKLRLVLASTLFTDGAFTASGGDLLDGGDGWLPPEVTWRDAPGVDPVKVRVFDELWRGTDQVPHWLGQPLGEAVHLAAQTPDLFEGRGESWPDAFIGRFEGERVAFSRAGTEAEPILAIRVTRSSRPPSMTFVLPGIDVPGKDLFVSLRLKAEPLEGFPASVPRRVDAYAVPAGEGLRPQNREFTWVGGEAFEASLYFQEVGPGRVNLRFEVEGEQQVIFESLRAHSATDGRYREYEGGVVFANPSTRSYIFDVGTLFPGVTLRRIQGSNNQDPQTNDGSVVGEQLTLAAKNGLFVVKEVSG